MPNHTLLQITRLVHATRLGLLAMVMTAASLEPASAQIWSHQYPGTASRLFDVADDGAGLVIAVGNDGTVMRSIDDGVTWNGTTATSGQLKSVAFCGTVLLAGGDALLRSTDGGLTWTMTQPLVGIQAIETYGTTHAWAVTSDHFLLRSTDAGATWSVAQLPGTWFGPAEDLSFIDSQRGWVGGGGTFNGQYMRTVDGGATWSSATPPASSRFYSLQRVDGAPSFLLEDSGTHRGGGANWTFSLFPWVTIARDFDVTSDFGVAVGHAGRIMVTQNNALNWLLSLEDGGIEHEGVTILGPQRAVVVGEAGRILRTVDGGSNWTVVNGAGTPGQAPWINGMFALDANTIFAAATGGVILRTDNGGATWREQDGGSAQTFYRAVHFHDSQNGFAVGEKQAFYPTLSSTHDGGLNWFEVNQLGMYDIWDVKATGPMTAFAASDTFIWKTVNGGTSWSSVTPTPFASYHSIEFEGTQIGWAAGTAITKTVDGGATWSQQFDNPGRIHGLAMVDTQVGWGVGTSGMILHTADGGATWTPQSSGVTTTLNTVSAINPTVAVAAGDGGVVLLTTDGGVSWNSLAPPGLASDAVRGSAITSSTLWIGGDADAGIWHYSSGAVNCVEENYCTGKVHSLGGVASMAVFGHPSVQNQFVGVGVTGAIPNTVGLGFRSDVGAASAPLWNATLCVQAPLTRLPILSFDSSGFAFYTVSMDSSMIGSSHWYQVFFRDVNAPDGTGVGMTDGLHLSFCP